MLTSPLLPLILFLATTTPDQVDYAPDSGNSLSVQAVFLKASVNEKNTHASVSIRYQLSNDSQTPPIEYKGLAAFNTTFEDVSVTFQSNQRQALPSQEELKLNGHFEIPTIQRHDSDITFVMSYDLGNALRESDEIFDIVIPVIWLEPTTSLSQEGLFQAAITIPSNYFLEESFPYTSKQCGAENKFTQYCMSLQALPSFIRLRGHIGHKATFTPQTALNVVILSTLFGMCILMTMLLLNRNQMVQEMS